MTARRKNKPTRPHPRGQKPMVKAGPSSDPAAKNALSSHVGGRRRPGTTTTTGGGKRQQKVRTHGPLGNVRVDKKTMARKKKNNNNSVRTTTKPATAADLQLNTSTKPAGIIHRRGKKGKKFADDANTLTKVLSVVTARMDQLHATKIERAQQLETIREAKRAEIEQRQLAKSDRLESKKKEIKNRKHQNHKTARHHDDDDDDDDYEAVSGKKQKVRFAV
ncbi:hypothetical protein V1509DRAFT_570289 [Lipomyces kononenkoae]